MTEDAATSARPVRAAAALGAAVVVADQASKWWVLNVLMPPPGGIEVTSFFNLVLVWNPGVTFGLFGMGGEPMRWILMAVTLAIIVALGVWLSRTDRALPALALGAVIGGAAGNLLDRLIHGQVADFLDFHAFGWHWPAFNLADSAIVCGVAALVLDTFLTPRERLD